MKKQQPRNCEKKNPIALERMTTSNATRLFSHLFLAGLQPIPCIVRSFYALSHSRIKNRIKVIVKGAQRKRQFRFFLFIMPIC